MMIGSHDASALPLQWAAREMTDRTSNKTCENDYSATFLGVFCTWHTQTKTCCSVLHNEGEHGGGGLLSHHPGLMNEGASGKETALGLCEMWLRISVGGGRWEGEKQTKLKLERGWETDRDRLTICVFVAISWGKEEGGKGRGDRKEQEIRGRNRKREKRNHKNQPEKGEKGRGKKIKKN